MIGGCIKSVLNLRIIRIPIREYSQIADSAKGYFDFWYTPVQCVFSIHACFLNRQY